MRVALLAQALCTGLALSSQSKSFEPSWQTWHDVEYARGLAHCLHGVTKDANNTCVEKRLYLDIYAPYGDGVALRPAILLVHGGANVFGDKQERWQVEMAEFWASNGYVVFNANYRLREDNGTFPGDNFFFEISRWSEIYPATRDVKAAVRFIHAQASNYSVDPNRIIASGDSAGAMNTLGAVASGPAEFTNELSLEDDPTLQTVHSTHRADLQAVILHWGNAWSLQALYWFQRSQHVSQSNTSLSLVARSHAEGLPLQTVLSHFFSSAPRIPALIQFHGDLDDVVKYKHATALEEVYGNLGVPHTLYTLNGSGHFNWSYGCGYSSQEMYCPVMDQVALEFILGLPSELS